MKRNAVRTRAAVLAPFVATLAGTAAASTQDLHVAVWGLDGNLVEDATVGFETAAGDAKGTALPDGCYLVANQMGKGELIVDHPALERVSFEVTLPERPMIDVHVLYITADLAEVLLDQPTKRIRSREGFLGLPPTNDLCEDAILLPTPAPGVTVGASGTTTDATVEAGLEFCGTQIGSPGVWYRIAGFGTAMRATTCTDLFDYDTKISVFCGTCAEPQCVFGNDDLCVDGASELLSTVSWCSEPGVDYFILVHGFGDQTGDFELRVENLGQDCIPTLHCGEPTGACCLPDGACEDGLTREDCEALGGSFKGIYQKCEGGVFFGYNTQQVGGPFVDISATGTPLLLGDDDFAEVPLAFEFELFGVPTTSIKVSSNGYLTTGPDATAWENVPCFDPQEPNAAIFGLWDDLDPSAGGDIHYGWLGPPGERTFIVQWVDVPEYGEPSDTATFQVRLLECCDTIELCYGPLIGVPSEPGDTTIGVENQFGALGHCLAEGLIGDGVCWTFFPLVTDPVTCPCRRIDFSTEDDFTTPLVAGQDVSSPPEFGELMRINGYGSGNLGTAIFDSNPAGPCAGGPDPDLLVDLGNVLILQSLADPDQSVPGFFDVPNDASTGGVITIEFLSPVELHAVDLIDLCLLDFYTQVFIWDGHGAKRTYAVPGGWTTDVYEEGPPGYGTLRLDDLSDQPGAHGTVASASEGPGFDPYDVVYVEIHMGNSGAIDNLEFCLTPQDVPTGN